MIFTQFKICLITRYEIFTLWFRFRYELMSKCWSNQPSSRPKIFQLKQAIDETINGSDGKVRNSFNILMFLTQRLKWNFPILNDITTPNLWTSKLIQHQHSLLFSWRSKILIVLSPKTMNQWQAVQKSAKDYTAEKMFCHI